MRAYYDSSSNSLRDESLTKFFESNVKIKTWLKVEAALAKAQAEVGMIPKDAAEIINEKANIKNIDLDEMERIKSEVGHGFVPFVKVFSKACGDYAGKYVHFGSTTQNIQQTSQLYILKNLTIEFKRYLADILENLSNLATEHADTVMAGRTHGRHAVPITFGYKVSVWIYELMNCIENLEDTEKRVYQAMMGGAIGAFNTMPEHGREIQKLVAKYLDMEEMKVPSRNINTHKIEYMFALSQIANVLHKMAEEVYYGGLEEMGEIQEPFKKGTIGSSTMPHKVNPKLAKGIITNASKMYSLLETGYYSNCRVFEGDSSQYLLFDGLIDEAIELMYEVLIRAKSLTSGMHIDKERMLKNIELDKGLLNIEHIMMELANVIGKDNAHSLTYDIAMKVKFEDEDLFELLRKEELLKDQSDEYLYSLLDARNYIGKCSELAIEIGREAKDKSIKLRELKSDL